MDDPFIDDFRKLINQIKPSASLPKEKTVFEYEMLIISLLNMIKQKLNNSINPFLTNLKLQINNITLEEIYLNEGNKKYAIFEKNFSNYIFQELKNELNFFENFITYRKNEIISFLINFSSDNEEKKNYSISKELLADYDPQLFIYMLEKENIDAKLYLENLQEDFLILIKLNLIIKDLLLIDSPNEQNVRLLCIKFVDFYQKFFVSLLKSNFKIIKISEILEREKLLEKKKNISIEYKLINEILNNDYFNELEKEIKKNLRTFNNLNYNEQNDKNLLLKDENFTNSVKEFYLLHYQIFVTKSIQSQAQLNFFKFIIKIITKYKKREIENKVKKLTLSNEKSKINSFETDVIKNEYDVSIEINSLKENQIKWTIFRQIKEQNSIDQINTVFSVLGSKKVGKKFIIQKILNIKIDCNKVPGLNLINSDNNVSVINTSSIHNDNIQYKIDEKIKKIIKKENNTLDYFIKDFVLYCSNFIIFVVNFLNRNDQKQIEYLKRNILPKKKIIIVYNYYCLDFENFNKTFQKDLDGLSIEESLIGNYKDTNIYIYNEKINKDDCNSITHMGLINNDKYYEFNNICFDYLKKIIYSNNNMKKFSLVSSLKKYFNENYQRYLNIYNFNEEVDFKLIKKVENEKEFLCLDHNMSYSIQNQNLNCPNYKIYKHNDYFKIFVQINDNINEIKCKFKYIDINYLMIEGQRDQILEKELSIKPKYEQIGGNNEETKIKFMIPLNQIPEKIKKYEWNYENNILKVTAKI